MNCYPASLSILSASASIVFVNPCISGPNCDGAYCVPHGGEYKCGGTGKDGCDGGGKNGCDGG